MTTMKVPMDAAPFRCPRCGHLQIPANPLAQACLEAGGLCQGCRAARTLRRRPWLLAGFVRTWEQIGFPESDSWLRDIPAAGEQDVPSAPPAAWRLQPAASEPVH